MPIIDSMQIVAYTLDETAIDDFIAANPNFVWDGEIFDDEDVEELIILGQISEEYKIVIPINAFTYEVVLCDSDDLEEEDE